MAIDLKNVGVVFNPDIEGTEELAQKIAKKLTGARVFSVMDKKNEKTPEFAMVIGGDGTLLKAARYYSQFDIPIFGFNMGRLGFLAQAKPNEIDYVLEKIKSGDFRIEERIMLEAVQEDVFGSTAVALNDFVIKGATFSRTSTFELFINDTFVSSYLADGFIISTPTGSTAYTLSAGGPVISPKLCAITIVAICPHTLTARPLVVSCDEKISIKLSAGNKYKITADGQAGVEITDVVKIQKSSKNAKLLLLDKGDDGFYSVLREKMHWGTSPGAK